MNFFFWAKITSSVQGVSPSLQLFSKINVKVGITVLTNQERELIRVKYKAAVTLQTTVSRATATHSSRRVTALVFSMLMYSGRKGYYF